MEGHYHICMFMLTSHTMSFILETATLNVLFCMSVTIYVNFVGVVRSLVTLYSFIELFLLTCACASNIRKRKLGFHLK